MTVYFELIFTVFKFVPVIHLVVTHLADVYIVMQPSL